MPQADVLLSQLGEASYISTFDLTKGYWQVPLRKADKEKTAFATLKGLYQFTMMPFELHGAAVTFQRLVDTVLRPCEGFTLVNLDKIGIDSWTWVEHLTHLRQVFELLYAAGLRVNPRKSKLVFQEIEYLGYLVGKGQLRPQANKVDAILKAAQPKTKKQLRQFLGLVHYYSHFIPRFATRAFPLTDMLGKLSWETGAHDAFEDLRQALISPPAPAASESRFYTAIFDPDRRVGYRPRCCLGPKP